MKPNPVWLDVDTRFMRVSSLLSVAAGAAGNKDAMAADERGNLEFVINRILDDLNRLHTDVLDIIPRDVAQ